MIEQKLHEECGVFGIYSERDDQRVASSAYLALYALQQDVYKRQGCGC